MNPIGKTATAVLLGGLAVAAIALSPIRAAAQETDGRKFAFLVGVEKYSHGNLPNLDFPENDVEELAETLTAQKFKTLLLTTRLGKTNPALMPTAKNVWSSLQNFIRDNKPDKADLMLIGLAGHGIQPLGSDESYFCPADANPTIKEGTKNSPANPESLISIGELLKVLDDSGVGYKLLFVDACRNDPSVRGRRGVNHVNVAALPEQTGVLLSCKAGEFSFEHKSLGKKGHGAFFYHVIMGLKGAASERNGDITWDDLGSYVRKRVPAKVRELFGAAGGVQKPNLISNISGEPAVLTRVTPRLDSPRTRGSKLLQAPFDANSARSARSACARYYRVDPERTNAIGMTMILIPAGRFAMGSTESPEDLKKVFPAVYQRLAQTAKKSQEASLENETGGEQPVHTVTISKPFYLAKYEVTKGQFKRFIEATHYRTEAERDGKGGWGYTGDKGHPFRRERRFTWFDWGVDQGDDSPVVNVSYDDAAEFCKWLSVKDKKLYRLPTEAEWEYAARAGTLGRYYCGDDPEALTTIGNVADATARSMALKSTVNSSDGHPITCAVGQFRPNNFGLYDMIGNAREWCADWYDADYYTNSPDRDPTGPAEGKYRVLRGGSWAADAWHCRLARRSRSIPQMTQNQVGFRVASSSLMRHVTSSTRLPTSRPSNTTLEQTKTWAGAGSKP
jgi:sulfatase modifying factor 1